MSSVDNPEKERQFALTLVINTYGTPEQLRKMVVRILRLLEVSGITVSSHRVEGHFK